MVVKGIVIPENKIADFCKHWNITRLEIFGSAVREDFTSTSDVDLLVEYDPDFHRTLTDMEKMQAEIEEIFNRPVDLITKRSIEQSPNPYKRKNILDSATVIYG